MPRKPPPNSDSNRFCAEAGSAGPTKQSVNAVSRMPPIRRSDLQSAITTVVSLRPDQLSRRLHYNAALQKQLQGPPLSCRAATQMRQSG
jgi:hypothetical protein